MRPGSSAPSDNTEAGEFARRLARARGTALQAEDGTAAAADMLTWGDALATARDTNVTSLDQAFVDTATDLLGDHERIHGLPVRNASTDASRRIDLLAKRRASFAGTIQNIMRAVRTIEPLAVFYSTAMLDCYPNEQMVFEYSIVIPIATYIDANKFRAIDLICKVMQPAGSRFNIGSERGFYTDGHLSSVTDRTIIGW